MKTAGDQRNGLTSLRNTQCEAVSDNITHTHTPFHHLLSAADSVRRGGQSDVPDEESQQREQLLQQQRHHDPEEAQEEEEEGPFGRTVKKISQIAYLAILAQNVY